MNERSVENSLGSAPELSLIRKYCVPTVISMTAGAIYNIVDQIFIGRGVDLLGIAATNITFPISTITIALAIMLGIGGAANYNLMSGAGKGETAKQFLGCSLSALMLCGVALMALILIFLRPVLSLLGATSASWEYARLYLLITALGIPFYVLGQGGGHLVRADGSPNFSLALNLAGAIINLILDPILIFVFHLGIAGAAIATVIGQWASGLMVLYYFGRRSNIKLQREHLALRWELLCRIVKAGLAASITNGALTVSQIVMNHAIKAYGAASAYGPDLPMACVGIVTKVGQVFNSVCIGIHQGCQPIFGFNYGARRYAHVKTTYRYAAMICMLLGLVFLLCVELLPRQIVILFGAETEDYIAFAVRFLRIYLMMSVLSSCFILISGFFTAIGRPGIGALLACVKYFFTLIPLILILPTFAGVSGIAFSGPISDFIAIVCAFAFARAEFRKMDANTRTMD